MDQLAKLGVSFTSDGAEALTKELKGIEAGSKSAEAATEKLTDAVKKASPAAKEASSGYRLLAGAMNDNNAHVTEFLANQKRLAVANDNAAKSMKAVQFAGLNLGRQFADVGVSLAGGINPMMVLIQQGPQVADAFATAAASGVGFRAVLTGLYAQIAPLVAAFAPWIAGLAAIGAGVYYLVDAHKKHQERLEAVNKAIADQAKELGKSVPSLIQNANSSDLAAEGAKNFEDWLAKSNSRLEDYVNLLKTATVNQYALAAAQARQNVTNLENENFRRTPRGGKVYIGKGSGIFDGSEDAGRAEYLKNARQAEDNLRTADERLRKAMNAPLSAFADQSSANGRKTTLTAAEEAEAAARREGRLGGTSVGDRGVVSVNTQTTGDYRQFITPYKPGGDATMNDPTVKSAEDAAKELKRIQDQQAKDRVDAQRTMWDNLISLSYSKNKKLAAIGKAAAIAQTTIDTYSSAMASYKALAGIPVVGPALGVAAAAAAVAAGLSRIAAIRSAGSYASGGYTGNGPVGAEAGVVHGQEFVVNAAATRRNRATLEAMNAGRAIPKNPAAANSNSRTPPIMIVPSPLFDVVVGNQAASVARPIARQEATTAGEGAVSTSVDLDQRRALRRLR